MSFRHVPNFVRNSFGSSIQISRQILGTTSLGRTLDLRICTSDEQHAHLGDEDCDWQSRLKVSISVTCGSLDLKDFRDLEQNQRYNYIRVNICKYGIIGKLKAYELQCDCMHFFKIPACKKKVNPYCLDEDQHFYRFDRERL